MYIVLAIAKAVKVLSIIRKKLFIILCISKILAPLAFRKLIRKAVPLII